MPAVSAQKSPVWFRQWLTWGLLPVLLTGAVSLSGCNWFGPKPVLPPGQQAPIASDEVAVFFSKYQGNQSIAEPVIRKIPEAAKAEPLKFALTELLKGPSAEEKTQGFYTEIPKGTQLLGVAQDPKVITINLSGQFATGGGSTSITQRLEELKRTIKAIDTQHEITVQVDGKPLELLGGEGLEVPGSLQSEPQ
ncbi:GerMN domain-containing protein [Vampirovibrio chlorellavorus]|uniref:GerMN domain-containing protein n=1 Tax=Vampirovibrio chlorellavorus TaxID=758823 RepID=UPI0026F339A9|nr:GerMN domain-containing protein [Vampirovibrio chlorellavorus]